jgi:uncharacterized membrane protein YhiD involved in acid resistance
MTAIGLAYGGGQLWLGIAGTLLAVVTLTAAKWIDEPCQKPRACCAAISQLQAITSTVLDRSGSPGSVQDISRHRRTLQNS